MEHILQRDYWHEPADIRSLLEAWHTLSDSEKIVLMLRNLIVGIERPEPSAL